MASNNIRLDEVMIVLSRLLDKTMTEKQKRILIALAVSDLRLVSTTGVVKAVSAEVGCAESTVWDAISFFKMIGVAECRNNVLGVTKIGLKCVKLWRSM